VIKGYGKRISVRKQLQGCDREGSEMVITTLTAKMSIVDKRKGEKIN